MACADAGPALSILHTRVQHPVGQGFFHSSTISSWAANGDPQELRYIYDCGSKHPAARQRDIEAYLGRMESRGVTEIDVLFLSHIHDDHINGLPRLLRKKVAPGVAYAPSSPPEIVADIVVLPMLEPIERLLAFAMAMVEREKIAGSQSTVEGDGFLVDMTVDPVAALRARGARKVIVVAGGDGGAPGREEPPASEDGEGPARLPGLDIPQSPLRIIGSRAQAGSSPIDVDADAIEITHSEGLAVPLVGGSHWRLLMYVDPWAEEKRDLLIAELKATPDKLKEASYLRDLVTNGMTTLTSAYKKVYGDKKINLTSLCVYSDIIDRWRSSESTIDRNNSEGLYLFSLNKKSAWLATGDADLRGSRATSLETHFGEYLKGVHTLTVPHHGAEPNSDDALYKAVKPNLCIVPAARVVSDHDADGNPVEWSHPATAVVRHIGDQGIPLMMVTDTEASRIIERNRFYRT